MSQARSTRSVHVAVVSLLISAFVAGCSSGSGQEATGSPLATPDDGVALRVVAKGFESPLDVTTAGDRTGRLFVTEQGGTIRTVTGGRVDGRAWFDISTQITSGGEQGLLGLAFHPNFPRDPRFFVDYTDMAGDTVVASYRVDTAGNPIYSSATTLLHIDQPFANHNGGNVVFGPDGYLYIGMGDGGSEGDPMGNGQNTRTLLGKLLRIDVDKTSGLQPYAIPPDNPYADGLKGSPEIWALGLRNPWRFSFDQRAGRLWIGDVGQSDDEEIDRVSVSRAGINYGWNVMEGSSCYESQDCDRKGLTVPVTEYSHDAGCSVTGGYVYRGKTVTSLRNHYVFGDYCSGTIWTVVADGPSVQRRTVLLRTHRSISSFGISSNQELYLTDLSGGTLLKFAPSKTSSK
jgi:glucose/arabinose dehydrogenase